MKTRLDQELARRGLVTSRSQAESYIKLGQAKVNGEVADKPSRLVSKTDKIELTTDQQYVSRAGLKLESIAKDLELDFRGKIVLDVGSSTGGFTDYALKHGAVRVVAVDVGSNQLHPSLHGDKRIELHEQTDIRDVSLQGLTLQNKVKLHEAPDIVLADVSFISLREILPSIKNLCRPDSQVVAMVKPQFEAGKQQIHKGIIKNENMRRSILKDFEQWARQSYVIVAKADSRVSGSKGNLERFYLLKP